MSVDIYYPKRNIRIDTMFWHNASPFAGTQEQLDELRADADRRAARRYFKELLAKLQAPPPPPSTFELHRPATRHLAAILHVGFIPLLWAITTCRCGDRWPCNDVKQHIRVQYGWSIDLDIPLKEITRELPKPVGRWRRLLRRLTRRRRREYDVGTLAPSTDSPPAFGDPHPCPEVSPACDGDWSRRSRPRSWPWWPRRSSGSSPTQRH